MDCAYEDDAPAASPPRSAGIPSYRRSATGTNLGAATAHPASAATKSNGSSQPAHKRFRRITTSYDKLDAVFLAFTHLVLIFDAPR